MGTDRDNPGDLSHRRVSSIGNRAVAASNQSKFRKVRHGVPYGLGLLPLASSVGLAAAPFSTMGTARADVFLAGLNAAF